MTAYAVAARARPARWCSPRPRSLARRGGDRGVLRRMQGLEGASATSSADRDDRRRRLTRVRVMGAHLLVLHSAVRACPGYSRHDAPSILMDGSSMARDTEHGRAVTAQITRRHGTLE